MPQLKVALTPRESQVLRLLAEGYCFKEISEKLGVRGPAVKMCVQRLKWRLDIPHFEGRWAVGICILLDLVTIDQLTQMVRRLPIWKKENDN